MKKKTIIIIISIIFVIIVGYLIGKQIYWNYKVAHAEKIVELYNDKIPVYQEKVTIKSLIK